jgi:single-strand DNA-binding protein
MSPVAPPGAAPLRSTVNDTFVTVVGNVVDSPRRVSLENGAVTNFRMASTARRYDAARQEFVDASTFWVDVECWNGLSGNVSASISKGDPVIVQGALSTNSWESENGRRSAPRIRAFAVGPNLARGTSVFKRDKSSRSAEPADPTTHGPQSPDDGAAEAFRSSDLELRAGRDYEDDAETLHGMNLADPPVEPAYV